MRKQNLFFIMRINLISILLGLFTTQSFAQKITITGIVKDQSGEPLIGVNVMEKGTTNGSITDMDGKYSVSSTGKKTILVFSYIGYISQEIPVANRKTIDVTMKEDTEELEEVVVIGYGTAKKKDLTGGDFTCQDGKIRNRSPTFCSRLVARQRFRLVDFNVYRCRRYCRPANTWKKFFESRLLSLAGFGRGYL